MSHQIETRVIEEIKKTLLNFGNKYIDEGQLKKFKIADDLNNFDENLMNALLSNEFIKKVYTTQIAGHSIFKVNQFIEMLQYKEFWTNSYTRYLNDIGLTHAGKSIVDIEDVVLDFPYKDTVLKAGMTKEDVKTHNEIFLNETLAKAEIDVLLEPKILKSIKKYSFDKIEETFDFEKRSNYFIKGNNLIALHSLKERFKGEIKLIYIDVPYYFKDKTDMSTFSYNSDFKLSTWLVFMKNRLEVAKKLLTEDGSIFVQSNDDSQAHLKVLMDEIFGPENYVNTVAVNMKNIAGASGGGEDKRLKKNVEFIHIYAKNFSFLKPFTPIYGEQEIYEHVEQKREENVSWKYNSVLLEPGDKEFVGETVDGEGNSIRIYRRLNSKSVSIKRLAQIEGITEKEVYYKFMDKIYRTTMPQSSIRPRVMDKWNELNLEENPDLVSIEYVPRSGRNKGKVYEQFYSGNKFNLFAWLSDVVIEREEGYFKTNKLGTYWDYASETKNLSKEGKVSLANGKKPEKLLKDIIESATEENDYVLDFFFGSGTTGAVALKLNRKFIGLEQIDYKENSALIRLQNVIKGNDGGITERLGWQGGGNFIYAELMEKNQGYIKDVLKATTGGDLKEIYQRMLDNSDLDFRVDLEKIDWSLPLEEQKNTMVSILDKNQLYYNFYEIDDSSVSELISESDFNFNKHFYGEGNYSEDKE